MCKCIESVNFEKEEKSYGEIRREEGMYFIREVAHLRHQRSLVRFPAVTGEGVDLCHAIGMCRYALVWHASLVETLNPG